MITKVYTDAQSWVPIVGDILTIRKPELFPSIRYAQFYKDRPRDEQYVVTEVNPSKNIFSIRTKEGSKDVLYDTFAYKSTRYNRGDVFTVTNTKYMKILKEALNGKQ